MKFLTYLIGIIILLFGIRTGECEMDAKTLIQLLNFYQTLIQDGEIQFLMYQKFTLHPDDVGRDQRTLISLWEQQMRENVPKSQNPEVLRKRILSRIENEKRYGDFRDSNENFAFVEGNMVFQVVYSEKPGEPWDQYAYRIERNFVFKNYPSLEHLRFFVGGRQESLFSNRSKDFRGVPPNQFSKDIYTGYLERLTPQHPQEISIACYIPPGFPIAESKSNEMRFTKIGTGEPTYLITYISNKVLKTKLHVRLKNKLPEIFQKETYYRNESPHTDTEEYWLLYLKKYRDFEWVPALNITFPKVREEKEFRSDGFMHRHTILTIKEMDFNLGVPTDFFDWDESELADDDGMRKHIRNDVEKEEAQATEK